MASEAQKQNAAAGSPRLKWWALRLAVFFSLLAIALEGVAALFGHRVDWSAMLPALVILALVFGEFHRATRHS